MEAAGLQTLNSGDSRALHNALNHIPNPLRHAPQDCTLDIICTESLTTGVKSVELYFWPMLIKLFYWEKINSMPKIKSSLRS
jgi:hypothetical protein